jgi:HisJ family histidinol phosphate phosphatase
MKNFESFKFLFISMGLRNPLRIFSKIDPSWDQDLHIHSNWSADNVDGPMIQEYIPLAEQYKLHICFTEHFEFLYYETHDLRYGEWRLNPDSIDQYLEEIDTAREIFPHISAGLEIDYYPQRQEKIAEFVDQYRDQFDLLIGSVHELEDFYPVTVRPTLNGLIEKLGSFEAVVDQYFLNEEQLIQSEIFDAIAHPDVIFRFINLEEKLEHPEYVDDSRLIQLGQLCLDTNTLMEVNTSGYLYEWANTLPSPEMVNHLRSMGVRFIVGSDSHNLANFSKSILHVRKMNNLIKKRV